jgi:FixJ family two-component response regulator
MIFIIGHGDVPTSVRAMKADVVEFLTKTFSDDELLGTIRHVIACSGTALDHEAEMNSLRDRASLTAGSNR